MPFYSNFRFGNFKVYKSILESLYSCFLLASLAKKNKAESAGPFSQGFTKH
jgi:hypothetical protein